VFAQSAPTGVRDHLRDLGDRVLPVDDHASRVADPVWDLQSTTLRRTGRVPMPIAWDNDIPASAGALASAKIIGYSGARFSLDRARPGVRQGDNQFGLATFQVGARPRGRPTPEFGPHPGAE
jgi:hypothetical protein